MATVILGQSAPNAATNTTIYTVTTGKQASFSVNILNRGASSITIRLAIAATATPGNAEWLEYDATIPANGVLERGGLVATAGKQIVAYVSAATASVSVYGYEE